MSLAAILLPGSLGRGAAYILWGLAVLGVLSIDFRLEVKVRRHGVRAGIAASVGVLATALGIYTGLEDPGLVWDLVWVGFTLALAWLGVDQLLGWAQDLPSRISRKRHDSSSRSAQDGWPRADSHVAAARIERKLERAKPTAPSQAQPTAPSQARRVPPVASPQLVEGRRFRDELDDAAPVLGRAAVDRLLVSYGQDWLGRVNARRAADNHPELKPGAVRTDPRVALKVIAHDPAFEPTVGPIWGKVRSLLYVANSVHHAREVSDDDLRTARATLRQLLDMASASRI